MRRTNEPPGSDQVGLVIHPCSRGQDQDGGSGFISDDATEQKCTGTVEPQHEQGSETMQHEMDLVSSCYGEGDAAYLNVMTCVYGITQQDDGYQEAMFVCPDDLVFVGVQPKCAIVQLGVEYGDDNWEWTFTQCFD